MGCSNFARELGAWFESETIYGVAEDGDARGIMGRAVAIPTTGTQFHVYPYSLEACLVRLGLVQFCMLGGWRL